MKQLQGPFPDPGFNQRVSANIFSPVQAPVSGELTAKICNGSLGAARVGGKVTDVWLSIEDSGKDDTYGLGFSGEVKINGTSCLSTVPTIYHVSGEASQQKTTKVSGDTGVTQAVIDADNNDVSPGDVLTYELTLARTASPTTEMTNAVLVVEFEPTKT